MKKRGKQYQDAQKIISYERTYELREAVDTLKGVSTAKFDETVELHLRTNVDTRHADQMVRGVAQLPHGLGKQIRVLVFADGEAATIARDAGADYIADSTGPTTTISPPHYDFPTPDLHPLSSRSTPESRAPAGPPVRLR